MIVNKLHSFFKYILNILDLSEQTENRILLLYLLTVSSDILTEKPIPTALQAANKQTASIVVQPITVSVSSPGIRFRAIKPLA